MEQNHHRGLRLSVAALALLIIVAADISPAAGQSFIGHFNTVTTVSSTVPANGDVNPYGVAQVPLTRGKLVEGQFLISNFNNNQNQQGTGTTIVQIGPDGNFSLFASIDPDKVSCPGGIGLTTALVALRSGFVIVGSLPTVGGALEPGEGGCLIVLNSWGSVVETISGHHINGPWDMTAADGGDIVALFVTNVLNGTVAANGNLAHGGTVVRLLLGTFDGGPPKLFDSTVVASGFPERTDPVALVIGPTGVAFDWDTGILYVADTLDNRIAGIPDVLFRFDAAHSGFTVSQGGKLNGPLGLALTPKHHLVEANGDDGNIVEIDPRTGRQVAAKLVDSTPPAPLGAGALFGLISVRDGVYFVDDDSNSFNLLH